MRSMMKGLLYALLMPSADMKKMQDEANFTELMVVSEGMKTLSVRRRVG